MPDNNTTAIVQARLGSTRLPEKALMAIVGKPMLWHIVSRLKRAKEVDKVVVATSDCSADARIADFCRDNDIPCFRGSENDVLDRFYQTAKWRQSSVVVRITGDCPLIDPEVVDRVLHEYKTGSADYVTNTLIYTFPEGLDVEVFSFSALETAWREAKTEREREHVTPYIRYSGRFKTKNVFSNGSFPRRDYHWSVDYPEDLQFVSAVYERLASNASLFFSTEAVIELLESNPELMEINKKIIVNEGGLLSYTKETPVPVRERSLEKSNTLKAKAKEIIPSCTQTFSKGPTQFVQGVAPVYLQKGKGCRVWDVDGNEYIDYAMGLAPVILGYGYPSVVEAVAAQIKEGTTFTLPHPLEIEVSQKLVELIPCAEMVRFGKNGSDATSGAIRAARAYTGRDRIACCGYHGWQDWYIGTTTRNKGIPEAVRQLTSPFSYNNLESLERIFEQYPQQIAAVIMEPVGVEEPRDHFLQKVKELAYREGAVLIFDEIVTGFRMALGGAQEYFGVIPDMACYGKAMGNGFPIAAIVGRRDIMELFDEIFFSFTFGGETASLAAALATIQELQTNQVIPHLWWQGQKIRNGFNVLARHYGLEAYMECKGYAPRVAVQFHEQDSQRPILKSLYQQECLKRGILFTSGHNLSYSHTVEDIDYTLRVYRTVMEIMAQAIRSGNPEAWLEGEIVQPVFRRY
ncbi:MAG: aminotransferase class III-fold pyridoxal phosphate-dependent enzyme [Candidatus Omnitrophota bacterium]|jgi:glutamate-1-semialdehyde 2,1-aminomutase/spore coat polysaccharide biosynthesis protein SpsF|nr:MAG: aminotransferase class III-fold pyridoxal phosphate-dependent enzyme [Candidatus Omnitrophota bacterium]